MRLTIVILIATLLQVSASSFGQRITISQKNVPLESVFKEIRKQSGYNFLYDGKAIPKNQKISISVKDATLNQTLDEALKGLGLSYEVTGKSVSIKVKEPSILDKVGEAIRNVVGFDAPVRGVVTNSSGKAMAGASVVLSGAHSHFLKTDNQGKFDFGSIAKGTYKLVVTYVGYTPYQQTVEVVEGNKYDLQIVLSLSDSKLDEVQVIAYGKESKRFGLGAVATVSAEQIEKQPVSNPLLALQGQVPGLVITTLSGAPGSRVQAQVRGQNTLAAISGLRIKPYDQPLFIIDGVPFAAGNADISQINNLATNGTSASEAAGISAINGINPKDIESISILKDAEATAVYGSKGANGVILITTKKGKAGKTIFNLNLNSQFNSVAKPIQWLNTEQYLQYRKDVFASEGLTPSANPTSLGYAPDLTIFDQNQYTDWAKVITGKNTSNTDVHASLSGGSDRVTFLVSTGYTRSTYNYPGDFADQRFTLHSVFSTTSLDQRFSLSLGTDYAYDQNNSASFVNSGINLPPNFPSMVDEAGNLIWDYKGVSLTSQNFYAGLKKPSDFSGLNFNTYLNLSYKIVQGLSLAANLGYNRNTAKEHSINPASAQNPSQIARTAFFADNAAQTINIEPQLNYELTFGKSVLTALLGGSYRKLNMERSRTDGLGYTSDYFLNSLNAAARQASTYGADLQKYVAARARLKYVYNQKYILEVSGSRDGSSNFGPGRQFGNFASAGAGWIFSEEKAFKKNFPFLSYGKLSATYGTRGSDAAKSYQYQALYRSATNELPFQDIKQGYPVNLYNPNFGWATKKSLNLAADLVFFDNRLSLNATYYRDRQGGQLVDYPLAVQSGFNSVFENQDATVQNKGWEFLLQSTNVQSKNFKWTSNFNISFNRNKLLSFPNLESSSYAASYVIGRPTSIVFGLPYKGVNPTTGLFEFYAANGSVTSSPNLTAAAIGGDMVPILDGQIDYTGGIGNTFTYKRFSLSVFCNFNRGDQLNYFSSYLNVGGQNNQPVALLGKYWKAPGDEAPLQRLQNGDRSVNIDAILAGLYFSYSKGAYSKITYLRVRTASLSYAFPEAWLKKVHVKSANIYVNAQNLFTISNYDYGDPEQSANIFAFPLQRIVAMGVSLNF